MCGMRLARSSITKHMVETWGVIVYLFILVIIFFVVVISAGGPPAAQVQCWSTTCFACMVSWISVRIYT